MTGVKILCYDIKYLLSNKMSHIKVKMHSTDLFMNLGFKVSKLQKRGGDTGKFFIRLQTRILAIC